MAAGGDRGTLGGMSALETHPMPRHRRRRALAALAGGALLAATAATATIAAPPAGALKTGGTITQIPKWMVPYCPGSIVEDRRSEPTRYYCVVSDTRLAAR